MRRYYGNGIGKAIAAISVAAVLAAGVCCTGFASRDANGKWFKNKDLSTWHWSDKKEENKPDTGDVIQEGNLLIGEHENTTGAELSVMSIEPEAYADYGVSAHAESAVTVSVKNIQPANASDTYIYWDYNFSGELIDPEWQTIWTDEEWQAILAGEQSDHDTVVSDFITVTPSEDTHSVVVECLGCFGAPITVTGTFRSNPNLKLSFTCNYLAKVENASFDICVNMNHGYLSVDTMSLGGLYVFNTEVELSWGTVFPRVVWDDVTISLGSTYSDYWRSQNGEICPLDVYLSADSFVADEEFIHGFFELGYANWESDFNSICLMGQNLRDSQGADYCRELHFLVNCNVFNGSIPVTGYSFEKDMIFEPMSVPVSGADLSKTEILF